VAELVIAFTVSGQREKYLRQSLDSWAKVRGVQDAHLLFCIEPGNFPVKEFDGWAHRVFNNVGIVVNSSVLNTVANTRNGIDLAFEYGARFAVIAEEDIEVATDTLEYFSWAAGTYVGSPEVIAVSAHCKASSSADTSAVVRASWFSPLISGTWKDRWEGYIRPEFKGWADPQWGDPSRSQAWDTNLRAQVQRDGRFCLFPTWSRANHIGEYSTWLLPVLAEKLFRDSQSDCFSASYPPMSYHEVPFDSVPGLLV
jgi:hypothetical protein